MSSGETGRWALGMCWWKAGTYLSLPGTRGRYLSTFTMCPTMKWGKQGRVLVPSLAQEDCGL